MSDSKHTTRARESSRPTASEDKGGRGGSTDAGRVHAPLKISDPAARKDLAALRQTLTSSPQKAGDFLRQVGVLTPTGRLSKKFGG